MRRRRGLDRSTAWRHSALAVFAATALASMLPPRIARADVRARAHRAPPTADSLLAPCTNRVAAPAPTTDRVWPAPLDRVVTLRVDQVALRVALARLAAEARVRFSYSPELVPVERATCVAAGDAALGDALVALLAGTGVAPVIAGADQVVLAPARTAAAADAPPEFARATSRLERVVVTGTATGAPERGSPFAVTVIEGAALSRDGAQSLGQLLDGAVPGLWMWAQSPTTPLARYGSLRGASSFGVSAPKVYVDGIEVANPLLLTNVDPSRIQRIEVIRGPQGAALYGADAISGVVNIVTRQEGVSASTPAAELRASGGASSSAFAAGTIFAQDHGAVLRAGTAARSASLGITGSTMGAFVPGAAARQLMANASARNVTARSVVSATAQFHAANADASVSPLLAGVPAAALGDSAGGRQLVRQYTLGTTVTLLASDRWTHALVAGVDGYRLAGVSADGMPVPSVVDSALRAARGGADRATLRLSSTARFGGGRDSDARDDGTSDATSDGTADSGSTTTPRGETPAAEITFGLEHSTARERTNGQGMPLVPRDPDHDGYVARSARPTPSGAVVAAYYGPPPPASGTTWWSNTGVLAQGRVAFANALFVNGGARVEYISVPANGAQVALLPMLGGAWLHERGPLAVKLRAAYGRGIRPARTVARGATWSGGHMDGALTSLAPESQAGTEGGVDLLWGDRVALRATRFDQRASGLVQPVALVDTAASTSGSGTPDPDDRRIAYQLQNVGAIDNHGWELQATSSTGPLSLAATLSLVSSRVSRLASGYRGDLRPGDRMLEVPARTFGLSATWAAPRWSLAATASRASDWINYDRLALVTALAAARASTTPYDYEALVGPRLREFWRGYGGVTHIGAHASLALGHATALTLVADNLLNRQVGEPDNITVLPGRTVTVGVRAGF